MNDEALDKLATEYIEQGNLKSLDQIAQELYGTTYRSLSAFGQQRIASMIGVRTASDGEAELMAKFAAERARNKELENQLQEAWDEIEFLETERFDLEMENLRLKNIRRRR